FIIQSLYSLSSQFFKLLLSLSGSWHHYLFQTKLNLLLLVKFILKITQVFSKFLDRRICSSVNLCQITSLYGTRHFTSYFTLSCFFFTLLKSFRTTLKFIHNTLYPILKIQEVGGVSRGVI